MLTTPEQYLSSLNFEPPLPDESKAGLSSGERAFVEKYLGAQILREYSDESPVPLLKKAEAPVVRTRPLAEPRIEIVVRKPEAAPAGNQSALAAKEGTSSPITVEIAQAQPSSWTKDEPGEAASEEIAVSGLPAPALNPEMERETFGHIETPVAAVLADTSPAQNAPEKAVTQATAVSSAETQRRHEIVFTARLRKREREKAAGAAKLAAPERVEEETVARDAVHESDAVRPVVQEPVQAPAVDKPEPVAVTAAAEPVEELAETTVGDVSCATKSQDALEPVVTLRELAARESSIRMVSFYVEGQLFLLPIAGIQEVVRNMELIKVPQTPYFIAGAINLRGKVLPLVHLSALLTNTGTCRYSEKNFIIIYGSANMQLGLIIDKISSMHMLDQDRIIWNVESRLGDAGDFLCAITNLNDRVCGIVAPELIIGKLLSS